MTDPALAAGELARLGRLRKLGLFDSDAKEEVLDGFTRLASLATGMRCAALTLVDAQTVWVKAAHGVEPQQQYPRASSFCAQTIATQDVFEVEDARSDPRFAERVSVAGGPQPPLVHYAAAPLVMPGGERVGALCVMDSRPGRLGPAQRDQLRALADQVVRVLLLRERERALYAERLLAEAVQLSELAPVGMFSADAGGRLYHANRHLAALLGNMPAEGAPASDLQQAIDARDRPAIEAGWALALAQRQPFQASFRTLPDPGTGAVRWLKMRVAAAGSGPVAFVGTVVDTTETVRLREALQAKNALLEAIFEHLPCGLAVFDRDHRHVASNRLMREMLDLPDALFEGPEKTSYPALVRHMAQRGEYGPGDIDELVASRMADHDRHHHYERTLRSGKVAEVRSTSMPDGSVVSTFMDVTGARAAVDRVTTSEQRLSRALNASRLGLWEVDFRSNEIYLSQGWARMLGYPAQALLLRPQDSLKMLLPDEQEWLLAERRRLLKGEIDRMSIEHRILSAAGEELWVLTEAEVAERDAAGRALKVVGTLRDVTRQVESAARLRAALADAARANDAKSEFLATMSHEIRTPLNGVIGLTQLLRGAQLQPADAESVALIDSCAKSLLSLVDNILDLSKIEAGKLTLQEVPTDLHQLVRETADVFSARAREKGIGFTCALAPQVPQWVLADPGRLRQVLLNLLGNALKFTDRGGFSLRVDPAPDGRLAFAVADSGIGIPQEQQDRLFTRFTQVDASASRRHQGSGLGLAISRELAQLMGGDVVLQSRPGAGSTFTLGVPLLPAAAPALAPAALAQAVRGDARILLAEDNEVNQRVALRLLAKLGYQHVTPVQDGAQAVAACRGETFDLVLMDCQMPEMDGLEATRALRALGHRMPVIAFTASATSSDREACVSAGMDDYLTKPVELAVLDGKLRHWLAAVAPILPVAPPGPPELLAFDPQAFDDYFLGDAAFFGEAREVFIRCARKGLDGLATALPRRDTVQVRALAHTLRGSAGTAGARLLADWCARLEDGTDAGAEPQEDWLAHARSALEAYIPASAKLLEPAPG